MAGNTEQGKCQLTNEYPFFLFLIGPWYVATPRLRTTAQDILPTGSLPYGSSSPVFEQ